MAIVTTILGLAIYNAWTDNNESHSHQEFFDTMNGFKEDTVTFMNRGGRNTSDMGRDLCERVNALESKTDTAPPVSCDKIYY